MHAPKKSYARLSFNIIMLEKYLPFMDSSVNTFDLKLLMPKSDFLKLLRVPIGEVFGYN